MASAASTATRAVSGFFALLAGLTLAGCEGVLGESPPHAAPQFPQAEAGDGFVDTVHKLKIIDKSAALTLLFKHLGLLIEKVEHAGEIAYKWKD